jgi:mono/diheme cytochrome c family protein
MKNRSTLYALVLLLVFSCTMLCAQEIERPAGGVVHFLEPILPDPILQHSKETYVLMGCAYCHGVDLKVRNGEAADLLHSRLVAADENANVLGALLRKGIPQTAKLSPMPQYSDLSDREISEVVQWIHYSRRLGHYQELMGAPAAAGDVAAGKLYFDKICSSCHTQNDMTAVVRQYQGSDLKKRVLDPAFLSEVRSFRVDSLGDTKLIAARARHGKLLENYAAPDVANLLAWLLTVK